MRPKQTPNAFKIVQSVTKSLPKILQTQISRAFSEMLITVVCKINTLFQNACFYSKFIIYCLHQEGEIIMQKNPEHTHAPLDALTNFVQSQQAELQQLLS